MPHQEEQVGEAVAAIGAGTLLKDRYRLERLLGRGGMASVWLASDLVLERPVAVKIIADTIASDPEFRARFRREARVAAGPSHPNLIGIYDYADGAERPYLVMEYVAGDNLAQRMSRKAAIDTELLARELLGALAHIHAAGIVHRDIKPQNILITSDGNTKLIDFGIALPADATALTRTGNLLGTARYIAPEVMRGERATERSDLYSCGVVLRDCMGSGAPANLRALVDRLCAEDPLDRPVSAGEALARLERSAIVPDQPTEVFVPSELSAPTEEFEAVPAEPGGGRRSTAEFNGRRLAADRPDPARRRSPGHAWRRVAAALAVCAALAAAFLVLSGDSGDKPGKKPASDVAAGGRENRHAADADPSIAGATSDTARATPSAAADVPEATGSDDELGSALNQEGYELIQAGEYESAVPILEEAVSAFSPGSEDLDYAYALFNLGNALRLSGRPEEAIPILEQRLAIPNQTEVVRRELAAARSEANS
jgi:eukaryotic-like serine/threonine-protein kinase